MAGMNRTVINVAQGLSTGILRHLNGMGRGPSTFNVDGTSLLAQTYFAGENSNISYGFWHANIPNLFVQNLGNIGNVFGNIDVDHIIRTAISRLVSGTIQVGVD